MKSVIHLGASGAVGTEVLHSLLKNKNVDKYTLLGRRLIAGISDSIVQKEISIFEKDSYCEFVEGHEIAICTLGVGQPSKISKEEFVKIDKDAVLDFAKVCKASGIKHFELLASVDSNSKSKSFYLRTKGELIEELKGLNFERLSVFMPSMILTPNNRYGILQWLTLKTWPIIDTVFIGKAKKYKGVLVEELGASIANNIFTKGDGLEFLEWKEFQRLQNL